VDHLTMLTDVLKLHCAGWHLARVKCLAALIVALFKVKTVNLTQLATAFPGRAEVDSPYRRLQRFFQHVESKPAVIAHVVVAFLPYTTSTLALDRTTWMLGCFPINFLVLSVVHQGIALPIFWTFLPKKGHANTNERMALLNKCIAVFGAHNIACLLADRAFIGEQWFASLQAHHIRFRIRIKRDMNIARTNGIFAPARHFFRSLPVSTYCTLSGARMVCGHMLWVTGRRLPSGEYLIVVADDACDHVVNDYKKRWKIEVLFEAFKSRRFNFEETHLKDEKRLQTLFAV
jgi:hypothetical protein